MEPLGSEFIRIVPDTSGFRAELQAQVAAALSGVAPQIAAAQSRLSRTTAGVSTAAGLPASTTAAVLAQTRLGTATKGTEQELARQTRTTTATSTATRNLQKNIQGAETAAGRYTRGMFAATAASSGLFRAVSFASGAFLAGALAGGAFAAAIQEFRQATIVGAQTAAILKATGGAANVTAGQVDALSKSQLRLTGIDDELVKSGANIILTFRGIRDQVGQGNQIFTRAVKDVQDISSVFGTALTGSAVQLGKALQDPIRGVTALRRSGITLSQSQRDLIKNLVETGRLLSAQKIILGEVEKQVGGTAAAIGRTLPGQLDILRERAKNALGEYVKRVSESRQATQGFSDVTGGLGSALSDLFTIARDGAAAFAGIAKATVEIAHLGDPFRALGGLRELVRVATIGGVVFGTLKVSLGLASFAQGVYTRATTFATVATVAEGAAAARTASILTRAGRTNLIASRLAAIAAARAIALGTGARVAAVRLGALGIATRAAALGLGLIGGPLGAAALGLTALTIGFIKLRQAAENAPGTLNAVKRSLDDLSNSVARAAKLQSSLAGRREDVSIANFNVQAATRDVTRARGAEDRSTAARGSLEQIHLTNAVTAAEQKLTDANKELAAAQRQADITAEQLKQNERSRQFVIGNTTKAVLAQVDALGKQQRIVTAFGIPVGIRAFQHELSDTTKLKNFDDLMTKLAASGDPIRRKVGGALEAIRIVLDRIPNQKQIALVVKLSGQGLTTNQILAILGIGRAAGTENIRAAGLAAAPTPDAAQEQQFLAAKAVVAQEEKKLKTIRETVTARNQELATLKVTVAAAQDAVANAREGLASAIDSLKQAQQALVDTVRASREAVNQAVTDAKANLSSLGQAVADALAKFQDAGGDALSGGKLGARFRELRDQILKGGGGPETQQAAQKVAFEIQSKPTVDTSTLNRQFADLTDAFDRGKIKLPQFLREFNKLIAGVNLRQVGRTQGSAAANALRDLIAGLRAQARLIARSPQREGGGAPVTLVNPLQAVASAARDIARAQKDVIKARGDVVKANRDLGRAIRDLQRAQTKETKANTLATRANTRVQEQRLKVEQAQLRLSGGKQKPKGDAAKITGDIVNAGGPR